MSMIKTKAHPVQNLRRRHRYLLILAIAAYVACFQWMYVNWLYPTFEYFGFNFNRPNTGFLLVAWSLSLLPALWMPIHLTRPSQLAYWVLYLMVLIPSMFVPMYAELSRAAEVGALMVTLFAGFAIVGLTYLLPIRKLEFVGTSQTLFWKGLGLLTATLIIWMVVVFRGQLNIVSFQDVYDLRSAANDLSDGSQVNYAFMLLAGAIDPFLMGYGLFYRRRGLFLIGALGQLLVYSAIGTKGSILSIVFIPGMYLLVFKGRRFPFALKLTFCCLGLLAGLCLSYVLVDYDPGPIHTTILFVVLMRTLSMNGLVTAQYFDFFQHNPLTYYSHIKGVNLILHYPFQYTVGQEIGLAYSGTTDLNATAHFWATDGIAALGLPGVIVISLFCAFVFWILDSASRRHDPRLGALVTTYVAYNLANISIFTSLLSGGFALLIAMLYLMPSQGCSGLPRELGSAQRAAAISVPRKFAVESEA
jgi:hypothetical protein